MTVATREKCPCCDFDSDGFGKNIIGKGYGSCEIRLYRATKYDFYIYSYSVGAEALLKDWFEIVDEDFFEQPLITYIGNSQWGLAGGKP
ncbi:MAG: hypothetical protein SPC26_07195 [Lactobacillus amylovorus]|nr:hypothetical protein [Lactobacillus amylovorus]